MIPEDHACIPVDGAQGRLKVMGNGVAETFQFLVGGFQFGCPLLHPALQFVMGFLQSPLHRSEFRDVAGGGKNPLHVARLIPVIRGVVKDLRRSAGDMADLQGIVPDEALRESPSGIPPSPSAGR